MATSLASTITIDGTAVMAGRPMKKRGIMGCPADGGITQGAFIRLRRRLGRMR